MERARLLKAQNAVDAAKKKEAERLAKASFGTQQSETQSKLKEAEWKSKEADEDRELGRRPS